MNWAYGPTGFKTRLEIVQDVATDLLDTINDVNVGLAYFNRNTDTSNDGGRIAYAIEDIETARGPIQAVINGLVPDGNTPLSETLYEAAQYFTGGRVTYGTASVAASREPGDSSLYHSPIDYNCQKNFIVYLTDGEPTRDDAADSAIVNMTDFPDPNADPARGSRRFSDLVGAHLRRRDLPGGLQPVGRRVSRRPRRVPRRRRHVAARRSSRRSRPTRSGSPSTCRCSKTRPSAATAGTTRRTTRRRLANALTQHRDDDSRRGHDVHGADGGRQRIQPHAELERPVHQRLPPVGPHALAGQPQEVPTSRERRRRSWTRAIPPSRRSTPRPASSTRMRRAFGRPRIDGATVDGGRRSLIDPCEPEPSGVHVPGQQQTR